MDTTFAIPNGKCRVGQSAKTPPFHGGMTGSTPVRGTKPKAKRQSFDCLLLFPLHHNVPSSRGMLVDEEVYQKNCTLLHLCRTNKYRVDCIENKAIFTRKRKEPIRTLYRQWPLLGRFLYIRRKIAMKILTALAPDQGRAIDVLTLAFSVDPMARWSLPDPGRYLSAFPSITMAFGGNAFEKGTAYIADNFMGASLWLPPGVKSDESTLTRLFNENTDGKIKADMQGIMEQMEKFHPAEPHWYLPMIGVDPAQQGSGIGSALMAEALKKLTRMG